MIVWGPCARLGGPFQSQWQRRHIYLFPNRIEIEPDTQVYPLEEINMISEAYHRNNKCLQLKYESHFLNYSNL